MDNDYLNQKIYEMKEYYDKIGEDKSWEQLAIEIGKATGTVLTVDGIRKRYYRMAGKNESVSESKPDQELEYNSVEMFRDGTSVSQRSLRMSETDMKNPEFIMLAHGFDPAHFDLISAKNNMWTGQDKDEGQIHHYQSKITVAPKKNSELTKQDIDDLVKNFNYKHDSIQLKKIENDELALEVDFTDVHIGSLSWHEETGEDFDYKIAFEQIYRVVAETREYIDLFNVSKLYLCFLGDFVHIDSEEGTTTKGTPVDTDTRPKKIVKKSLEIIIYIIENLACVPTEVIWVEGNHSRLVEYTIFQSLPFIFEPVKHIKFEVSPKFRKAFMFHKNLVGLHHGEMGKENMFTWLQQEYRELWGMADYVEQHSGHIHQEKVTEKAGIIQRTNPTSKAQDAHEAMNGWSSNKATIAYLWSKNKKLKAQFYLR